MRNSSIESSIHAPRRGNEQSALDIAQNAAKTVNAPRRGNEKPAQGIALGICEMIGTPRWGKRLGEVKGGLEVFRKVKSLKVVQDFGSVLVV